MCLVLDIRGQVWYNSSVSERYVTSAHPLLLSMLLSLRFKGRSFLPAASFFSTHTPVVYAYSGHTTSVPSPQSYFGLVLCVCSVESFEYTFPRDSSHCTNRSGRYIFSCLVISQMRLWARVESVMELVAGIAGCQIS